MDTTAPPAEPRPAPAERIGFEAQNGRELDHSDSDEDSESDDENGNGGNGGDNDEALSLTGRWAFMTDFANRWRQGLNYSEVGTPSNVDRRFGTFFVYVGPGAAPGSHRKLLYATELVAYMLHLDPETWKYAKLRDPSWSTYDPSLYDAIEFVPTMTFTLNKIMTLVDDELDAVQRLHTMLLDPYMDEADSEYAAYAAAKQQILEKEDSKGRLRGFKIPMQVMLRPPSPANANELRAYLRDAVATVRAFQHKCEHDRTVPFRLTGVRLFCFFKHCGDAHAELRELLSLVPTAITLRHVITSELEPHSVEWTVEEGGNMFPALADNPADIASYTEVYHTLNSMRVSNCHELWSTVAFSSSLTSVCVQSTHLDNPELHQQLARWMGYGLACSRSLQSLEIVRFHMTHDELDVLEVVLACPVPASLVSAPSKIRTSGRTTTLISLKPGTLVENHPGGRELEVRDDEKREGTFQSLEQLHIGSDWQFPVVQTIEATQQVEFVVPGYGICTTPVSNVDAFHELPSESHGPQLKSLVIRNAVDDSGITGRFVHLVGRALRELRWHGRRRDDEHDIAFDKDLLDIAAACPQLESLTIESSTVESLTSLASLRLRELVLIRTHVPTSALIAFLQLLEGNAAPIAKTLQRLTFYCSNHQLSSGAVDAVVNMLEKNRRMYSIAIGVESEIYPATVKRLDPATIENPSIATRIVVEKSTLATKLAFLSVVHHHYEQQPTHPLGQLDSGCISQVFKWFVRTAGRRVTVGT